MKDKRYANRGRTFEEFIRFANDRYKHTGLAMVEKIPTEFIPIRDNYGRIRSAKVEQKSTVDFIGRYKSHPLAMEAKNTTTDTIRFDRVERHQFDFLRGFNESEGVITLILLSFDLRQFYVVPWVFWQRAYEERVIKGERNTPLTVYAHGVEWDIPRKLSVRQEEIPDVFAVTGNHTVYGLHYLMNAEKWVNGEDQI